ncbi:MAG: GntR family transcriptional regulator [Cytobacillus gottheilii]|nr:GntR family transcriptional regulator [Cytobacillus gottheilii]
MLSAQTGSKVYVVIVKKLREMIAAENLKPGDKLPSERELSERLKVGRSSVREAFRALELLGLIETRRGEGTFIRDFKGHQLVQVLSTFILQDEKAKKDIKETKFLIELDCLWLIMQKKTDDELLAFKNWAEQTTFTDDEFFYKIILLADNHLFLRMWEILKDYYNSLDFPAEELQKHDYLHLIEELQTKEEMRIRGAYKKLRKLVE